ncbi:hypothetical protein D9M72_615200 [compost metagenome]
MGTNTRSGVIQICPPLPALPAAMLKAALFRSALDETITGDLPPSSRVTGTRFFAALPITRRPIAVLPVNTR